MSDEEKTKRAAGDDAADLLCGAAEISQFLFRKPDARRRVYHLYEHHGFPAFKVGGSIFARRSTILKWIAEKEK